MDKVDACYFESKTEFQRYIILETLKRTELRNRFGLPYYASTYWQRWWEN